MSGSVPSVEVDRAAFVARLWTPLGGYALSEAARELVVAHAALECDWGSSRIASVARNFWNLTCGKGWLDAKRPYLVGRDLEYHDDGAPPARITSAFRAYRTDDEAVADYIAFLRDSSRYQRAFACLRLAEPGEFVRWLHDDDPTTPRVEGGFFTLPLAQYQLGFAARLADVRRIRRTEQAARELLEQGRAKVDAITREPA